MRTGGHARLSFASLSDSAGTREASVSAMDESASHRRAGRLHCGPASRRGDALLPAARTAVETSMTKWTIALLFLGLPASFLPRTKPSRKRIAPPHLKFALIRGNTNAEFGRSDYRHPDNRRKLRAYVFGAPLDLGGSAKWQLVERSKATREAAGQHVRWRIVYRFAREPAKELLFQFPDVKFRDPDEQTVPWNPLKFAFETQITQPDRSNLHNITAIEKLPPIERTDRSWVPWLALAAVLLLVAAFVGVYYFRRRPPSRTPAEVALNEWQRLLAMKLPEKGRSERFVTLLTMLVRRYLERQFALPARRQTTPEFVNYLVAISVLTPAEKQFLTDFLRRCDSVKFAKSPMSVDECNRWANAARQFLFDRR